jgi:hypothetical protein
MRIAGECKEHGYFKGERCLKCSEKDGGIQVLTFTPHTYEDIGLTPIRVSSKRQLKEECKKAGVVAERLM